VVTVKQPLPLPEGVSDYAVGNGKSFYYSKARLSGVALSRPTALKEEAEEICGGKPGKPKLGSRVIAAIKWVDGTVIDAVRQVLD